MIVQHAYDTCVFNCVNIYMQIYMNTTHPYSTYIHTFHCRDMLYNHKCRIIHKYVYAAYAYLYLLFFNLVSTRVLPEWLFHSEKLWLPRNWWKPQYSFEQSTIAETTFGRMFIYVCLLGFEVPSRLNLFYLTVGAMQGKSGVKRNGNRFGSSQWWKSIAVYTEVPTWKATDKWRSER